MTLVRTRKRGHSATASRLHSPSPVKTTKHDAPTLPPQPHELADVQRFEAYARSVGDYYARALNVGRLTLRKR